MQDVKLPGPPTVDTETLRGWLTDGTPVSALDAVSLPFDRPVVTVCAAGRTSLIAAALLAARGHTAYSLSRGMSGWTHAWNIAEVPVDLPDVHIIQVRRTGRGCLSYVVAAGTDAAVIDPSVAPEVYEETAASQGWTVRGVVDTHVHADHLMRSRMLAERHGAAVGGAACP